MLDMLNKVVLLPSLDKRGLFFNGKISYYPLVLSVWANNASGWHLSLSKGGNLLWEAFGDILQHCSDAFFPHLLSQWNTHITPVPLSITLSLFTLNIIPILFQVSCSVVLAVFWHHSEIHAPFCLMGHTWVTQPGGGGGEWCGFQHCL